MTRDSSGILASFVGVGSRLRRRLCRRLCLRFRRPQQPWHRAGANVVLPTDWDARCLARQLRWPPNRVTVVDGWVSLFCFCSAHAQQLPPLWQNVAATLSLRDVLALSWTSRRLRSAVMLDAEYPERFAIQALSLASSLAVREASVIQMQQQQHNRRPKTPQDLLARRRAREGEQQTKRAARVRRT